MAKKPTEALPRSLDVEAEPTLYNRNSLTQALGVSYYHKIIIGIWKTIARQQAVGATAGIVTVGGEPVQWRIILAHAKNVPHFEAAALPAFRTELHAIRDSGPGDLTRNALARALKVSHGHGVLKAAWDDIAKQQAGGAKSGTITVGGQSVTWRMMRSLTTTVPYLPASALPAFRAAIGASPDKGPGNAS